eukprot:scaffold787_cov63-Phaeocystis_antarctica.AAC.5
MLHAAVAAAVMADEGLEFVDQVELDITRHANECRTCAIAPCKALGAAGARLGCVAFGEVVGGQLERNVAPDEAAQRIYL